MAILIGALGLTAFAWAVILILTLRGLSGRRSLLPTTDLRFTANDAPLVSILVPARNEEHRVLETCVRSILAQHHGTRRNVERTQDLRPARSSAAAIEKTGKIEGNGQSVSSVYA